MWCRAPGEYQSSGGLLVPTVYYRWNGNSERYIAPSGRFVSRSAVRATLDVVLDRQMSRISAVSDALVAGDVELPVWRQHMLEAVKTAHLEGAAVAKGGWMRLTQDDYEWVGQRVRGQLTYLQAFHDSLASGIAPMDGTVGSRAAMYVEAGRGTQRVMEARMAQARGVDQEKNVLGGSRDPCSECPALSAMGWQPVGSLPPVGARQCLSRCKCHLLFRTTRTPLEEGA